MKRIFLVFSLVFIFAIGAKAQEPTPTPAPVTQVNCTVEPNHPKCKPVTITQGFLDDSTAAFKELVALRAATEKLLKERALTITERKAYEAVKAALDDVILVGNKINEAHEALEKTYQKIIQIQNDIIDKLSAQLNKKKSFLDKVLGVLKNTAILLAGITIGRGIPL